MVMNRPMPAVMAFFRPKGMASASRSRSLVREMMAKTIPSTMTAARETCQE